MNKIGNIGADTGFTAAAFLPYPRNCWYVAGGCDEIGRVPLRRQLLDKYLVLYRKEDGAPVAMDDHCPHRGYPLSKGKLIGDALRCGYHGMVYDSSGTCIKIAGEGKIPAAMQVRSYRLVEKWHWLWIWMGDPEKADPALIPHAENEDNPAYEHRFYFTLPFYGNFQLAQENLLDSTHASYLHAGLLDTEDNLEFTSVKKSVAVEGDLIRVCWEMPNFTPTKEIADYFHVPVGVRCNRRVISLHHLPCAVNIYNQFYEYTPVFDGDNPGRLISEHITAEAIVPANANHSYHFRAVSTNYPQDAGDIDLVKRVLLQDTGAFEEIQRYFDEYPDQAGEVFVEEDRLGGVSRAKIAAMVRREAAV